VRLLDAEMGGASGESWTTGGVGVGRVLHAGTGGSPVTPDARRTGPGGASARAATPSGVSAGAPLARSAA
jgi:hypothetical protein